MPVSILIQGKAQAGKEAAMQQALLTLVEQTRSQPGCVYYLVHQSVEDPTVFLIYERWESQDAMARNEESPHFKSYLAQAREFVAGPPQVTPLIVVA